MTWYYADAGTSDRTRRGTRAGRSGSCRRGSRRHVGMARRDGQLAGARRRARSETGGSHACGSHQRRFEFLLRMRPPVPGESTGRDRQRERVRAVQAGLSPACARRRAGRRSAALCRILDQVRRNHHRYGDPCSDRDDHQYSTEDGDRRGVGDGGGGGRFRNSGAGGDTRRPRLAGIDQPRHWISV